MMTGNFALIAGLDPQAVNEWYRAVYVDAFDWVVGPNVLGLTLYADGGVVASKPYAASANYINRMSDYCGSCSYDPKKTLGERACPFNGFYWDFLARNAERLMGSNPRMTLVLANLKRRSKGTLEKIRSHAAQVREWLGSGGDA